MAYWGIFFWGGGGKIYKSCIWTLYTRWGCNFSLFSLHGKWFPKYRLISKLSYLGIKPGIWKSSRSCIWTLFLFLPKGVEMELIFTLWAAVSKIRADFQNYHIWAWNLEFEKSARSFIWTLLYPRGSKLSSFSLYGQRFLRYGLIYKIVIFGHETWPLAKIPEVAHTVYLVVSFYPRGRNGGYFRSRSSGFRDMGRFTKLPYLGMKFGHWPKCQKLAIYLLSTLGGEIELIFALRAAVSEIRADFKNYHIWAWNLDIGQSSGNCTYSS